LTSCADSSFVLSLYIPDAHSAAAARKIAGAQRPLLLTDLTELEFANAIGLRLLRKELHPAQANDAQRAFRNDAQDGFLRIVPLPSSAFQYALRIATQRTPLLGTRTIDVLQVAAALALKGRHFYTFDLKQAKLAIAEGLRVP
jgi:predicted nucleic acid-binding protein